MLVALLAAQLMKLAVVELNSLNQTDRLILNFSKLIINCEFSLFNLIHFQPDFINGSKASNRIRIRTFTGGWHAAELK